MKKVILAILLSLFCIHFSTFAETKLQDNVLYTVKSEKSDTTDIKTNYFFQTKQGKKPIYKGKKGGYYYIATSKKTGKQYKKYLTKEQVTLISQ